MAETLFLLDIHYNSVVAVAVNRNAKECLVTGCGAAETLEQSFEVAIDLLKEQTGFVAGRCFVTLGAELFSFRNVTLPFTDRKKIEQVLPFELDDKLPTGVKSVLVDFVIAKTGTMGAEIIAATIDRKYLLEKLAILLERGIDPDIISISGFSIAQKIVNDGPAKTFVIIDVGQHWANLFIVVDGLTALIRSLDIPMNAVAEQGNLNQKLLASVQQTLLASRVLDMSNPTYNVYLAGMAAKLIDPLVLSEKLGGVEVCRYQLPTNIQPEIKTCYQPEEMDRVLATALKGVTKSGSFNFRKDELKKRISSRELRSMIFKFALPMVLVLLAVSGYWANDYRKLLARQELLRSQIVGVFKETWPGSEKIVNPVQQLQIINKQIRATYKPGGDSGAGHTIIDLLVELSVRIPASYKVRVLRLVADADTLRIRAVTGDFNTVDNTQKELEKSSFFKNVVIISATQSMQGDEVNFELKLELTRE
jgi:general secretion pathway protein L